ncbi:hypothetical protein LLH00_09750 [bacterium]|nr:hypothetical protein [bacterium]
MDRTRVTKMLGAVLLALLSLCGCAGGSLFSPRPLVGRDRLVYQVQDHRKNATYYTRNVWFDGDNYRFHDVYGRDMSVPRSDSVLVDLIGPDEYYKTP